MATISFGQSGNASSGSYTGPWNQGTQYIYSIVSYPTGNFNIDGTRVVSIDSVSLSGSFSATGGYTVSHTSDNRVRVTWNSAYRLDFTRYIDNGLDLYGTPSGFTTRTDGGLRGVTTWSTVPAQPAAPVQNGVSSTSGAINLAWTAPSNGDSTITSYQIDVYNSAGTTLLSTINTGSSSTTRTITELTPGTSYRFTVAAINKNGTGQRSSQSVAIQAPGLPTPPSTVTATTSTTTLGAINVSWSGATAVYGSITGYNVYYRKGTSGTFIKHNTSVLSAATSSYVVTGLDQRDSYQVMVRTLNGWPTSTSESANSSTPSANASGVPTPPQNLIATSYSSAKPNQIDLSWSAPANSAGTITGYNIYMSETSSSGPFTLLASVGASPLSYSATNLPDGGSQKTLWFYVVAKNTVSDANSTFSAASNIVSGISYISTAWSEINVPPLGRVGESYPGSVLNVASGATYAMSNQPPGISIDTNTGIISGIPTEYGKYLTTITSTVGTSTISVVREIFIRPGGWRSSGSSFIPLTTMKIKKDGVWVDVSEAKRNDGSGWVKLTEPTP